ncbi:MAG: DUF120 domain-containing protein [Thermoplasmata archaeon]|nr:DUF120 domain-containing protein [Thermoplasmata archaeon]
MDKRIRSLKILGLKGALNGFVTITSAELGELLDTSQQTASNRILALLDDGLLERKVGTRHQKVKITKKGSDLLYREYADYQVLFKPAERITITGSISTGLGEGQYYVARYKKQLRKNLGFTPFEGTLNLTVGEEEIKKLGLVPRSLFIEIDSFEADGRSFGKVSCLPAQIRDVECAVVIPKRSHHNDVIEVLAQYNLRESLGVGEGDVLEIVIKV